MSVWLQWGVNLLTITFIGLIGFFAKRYMTQNDKRLEEKDAQRAKQLAGMEHKILGELERFRTENDKRHSKTEERVERVEERLNKTLQELPTMYTLREDWLRTSSDINRKLDKITDILIRGGKASNE
jgi:uncharacterized protein HemX